MRLKDCATIKTNFPDADFWLVRSGSVKTVGQPTKVFNRDSIGIKVTCNELLPDYLYYAMMYLHTQGYWTTLAHGALPLVHITVAHVQDIRFGPSPAERVFRCLDPLREKIEREDEPSDLGELDQSPTPRTFADLARAKHIWLSQLYERYHQALPSYEFSSWQMALEIFDDLNLTSPGQINALIAEMRASGSLRLLKDMTWIDYKTLSAAADELFHRGGRR